MNVISIVGRVGRDIEIRHTASGDPVGSFSIADDQGKDKPAIWWNCDLWGRRADSLGPYIIKGAKVCVSGEVIEREYTDKQGQQRKTMSIRVGNIDPFCGGKPQSEAAPAPRTAPAATNVDMDIPF